MKRFQKSLYWKLTIAFLIVAFSASAMSAIYIRFNSQGSLWQLLIDQQHETIQQSLQNYYAVNGSWDGVVDTWDAIQRQVIPTPYPPPPGQENVQQDDLSRNQTRTDKEKRNFFGLANPDGTVIVSVDPAYPAGSILPKEMFDEGTEIIVNKILVGRILQARRITRFNPEEAMFLERTNQALMLGIITGLLVALGIGIFLARTLTRPLRELTHAAQNIAEGHLEQEVKVTSHDEIGQLAEAFNEMSHEVARVNASRRQMTADIAHDLRTPLTVIAGYIESMQEGVLQPSPERFALIYTEIERLQHLVGDLRMLSQADAGELSLQPQSIMPKSLLNQAAALFQHHAEKQSVSIGVEADENLPAIMVDEARMMQVMDNLISNALRYTPENGRIILGGKTIDGCVELSVSDTGSGISPEELPLIFDRFHRADKSRHSDEGESGLGLAIVKALIESQGGKVWAESESGRGTTIKMRFKSPSLT
ncbi:MAG: cell wall metabolism sensor histidine kinase WalK [Leptolinea sp.]|jgi:signal transduction histidine kinase|nr:cell wall metabolism sensor histidine kinase WalK [Leptolinea sp.]